MITSQDPSTAATASSATRAGGKWLYPLLLLLETAGAVLLCSQVLPIYRKALANPRAFDPETTEYTLAAVVLMQIGYWVSHWIRPARPRVVNTVLGHIVLFVARLLFLLPTAVFSFLFIAKTLECRRQDI